MNVFKYFFWIFYRVWFYLLVSLPIIVLLPLLIISILKESWYPFFFRLARFWARFILIGMGFYWIIEREQKTQLESSYMFIANHTSMTDIMLMLVTVKNPFVFVGKKELAKIPLFGFFYKRTCILVDRDSLKSRHGVFERAQKRLESGLSICIFPEGGVPDQDVVLDQFKDGAFRLAINHQIPVVPITFADNKKRYPFEIFNGGPGKMRVHVHKFLETQGMTLQDCKKLKETARNLILSQLNKFHAED